MNIIVKQNGVNMEDTWKIRTSLLLGEEAIGQLAKAHVLIVGLGGVGAAAAETIARAGVGYLTLADADVVEASNRNRQLGALVSTEGKLKVEVWKERVLDINPEIQVRVATPFLIDTHIEELLDQTGDFPPYNFVIDAIDTLSPKVHLIKGCLARQLRFVTSLGAGGKMDPMQVHIADISQSYGCRMARYLRKRLHQLGIRQGFPVVFSPEPTDLSRVKVTDGSRYKKAVIGTISYLPPFFGCCCASVAIRTLLHIPVGYRP
jgi:tRNA A37 threonylcarbamoyladenosine dehydratase